MGAAKKLSWKPVRRGDIFCAPACGGNCTWAAYLDIKARGERAARELGPGWTVEPFESLGWHVHVMSPCRRITVSVRKVNGKPAETLLGWLDEYTAYFNKEQGEHGGHWTGDGATPREAVNAAIANFMAEFRVLRACLAGLSYWKG